MKHKIPARKKLTALALTQPKESLPIGEFTHIIRIDRYFKVILKWMEAYSLVNDANNKQLMGKIEVLTPVYKVVYMELFTPKTYNRIYAKAVETYPNHYIQITFKSKL